MRLLPLILLLFLASPAAAQTPEALTSEVKATLDEAAVRGDYHAIQATRVTAERVAAADGPHAALAHYYAALAGWRLTNAPGLSKNDRVDHANAAIDHAEAAVEADPDFAEAYALLGSLYGQKSGLQPLRAMFYGPKAESLQERAVELAPENPRVVLIAAQNTYFKPSMWGGDKAEALAGFERAAALFEQAAARSADPLHPTWGHAEAYAWIGIAHEEAGRGAQARAAFERALALEPSYAWVKNVLLPGLER